MWRGCPTQNRSVMSMDRNKRPAQPTHACGGVDSYDLDATVDSRSSKGACHIYNKFNMDSASNMFVVEYASRPPMAKIFTKMY